MTSGSLMEQICSKTCALSDADFSVAEASARGQAEYRNPTNPEMQKEVNERGACSLEAIRLIRELRAMLLAAPGGAQRRALAQQPIRSNRRAG